MPITHDETIRRLNDYIDAILDNGSTETLEPGVARAAALHLEILDADRNRQNTIIIELIEQVRQLTDERHQHIADLQAASVLDDIKGDDPEAVHTIADEILLTAAPTPVADAYRRLRDRCAWWAAG